MNIALGDYTTAEFTAVGHTTTSVPVNIALNSNANTRVNATINADAETSQAGTVKSRRVQEPIRRGHSDGG